MAFATPLTPPTLRDRDAVLQIARGLEVVTMAIYHLHVQVISRADGRSAVAAAAYRAGWRMEDKRLGLTHDFTRKGGIIHSEVDLPDSAPERFRDRVVLWNEVEAIERSGRAQLAREVEFALPAELSHDEQIELARDYIADNFVGDGMIADWSLHDTREGNPHVHCMLTMRSVNEDGFLPKAQKTYLCRDADGGEGWYTAAELKEELEEDPTLEKVYRYGGEELTRTQAAEQGLTDADRDNKYPVSNKIETNDWNDRERVTEWRKSWQEHYNAAMERWYDRQQVTEENRDYVDCRSLAAQGIERQAQVHEGVSRTIEDRDRERMQRIENEAAMVEKREPRTVVDRGDARAIDPDDRILVREPVTEIGVHNADAREEAELERRVTDLRGQLHELYDEFKERFVEIREKLSELPNHFRSTFERICDRLDINIEDRVTERVDPVEEARDKLRELLERAESICDRGRDTLEEQVDDSEELWNCYEEATSVFGEVEEFDDHDLCSFFVEEIEDRAYRLFNNLDDWQKWIVNDRCGYDHDDDGDAIQHKILANGDDPHNYSYSKLQDMEYAELSVEREQYEFLRGIHGR